MCAEKGRMYDMRDGGVELVIGIAGARSWLFYLRAVIQMSVHSLPLMRKIVFRMVCLIYIEDINTTMYKIYIT